MHTVIGCSLLRMAVRLARHQCMQSPFSKQGFWGLPDRLCPNNLGAWQQCPINLSSFLWGMGSIESTTTTSNSSQEWHPFATLHAAAYGMVMITKKPAWWEAPIYNRPLWQVEDGSSRCLKTIGILICPADCAMLQGECICMRMTYAGQPWDRHGLRRGPPQELAGGQTC